MFAYSNNGLSFRAVDPAYVAASGEVLFATNTPTTAQLEAAFSGYAAAVAAAAVQTRIGPGSFLKRFTSAELAALMNADPTWAAIYNAEVMENGGMVDVTNSLLIADLTAAAAAGTLTAARVAQILNLSVASP